MPTQIHPGSSCTAFEGTRRIATGYLRHVALEAKDVIDRGERGPVLIFDDVSSELIELDFRGSPEDVVERLSAHAPRRPGRPKLGVVAREVTLLPRHWDWLNSQPGGASVALRKLVEEARRSTAPRERIRQAQEAGYRFMTAMAGNEAGYEEALRALFSGERERFLAMIEGWPADVREHAQKVAAGAFAAAEKEQERE